MNMAGLPRHVEKALDVGVDIICASGTEGGAHTGDVSTLVLIPQCADMCAGPAGLKIAAVGENEREAAIAAVGVSTGALRAAGSASARHGPIHPPAGEQLACGSTSSLASYRAL